MEQLWYFMENYPALYALSEHQVAPFLNRSLADTQVRAFFAMRASVVLEGDIFAPLRQKVQIELENFLKDTTIYHN